MRWAVYGAYARATGAALAALIVAALLLMQASRNGSDLWLSFWVSRERERLVGPAAGQGLWVYLDPKTLSAACTLGAAPLQGVAWAGVHGRQPWGPWWVAGATLGVTACAEPGLGLGTGAGAAAAAPLWAGRLPRGGLRGLSGYNQTLAGPALTLLPGVRFHLSVLLLFAAANSLFTLVRLLMRYFSCRWSVSSAAAACAACLDVHGALCPGCEVYREASMHAVSCNACMHVPARNETASKHHAKRPAV